MSSTRQRDVQTPHFKLPFSFGGIKGGAIVNEQDTEDDVIDCIKVIIAYPVGSREDHPSFGCPDLVFKEQSETTMTLISSALLTWEPRSETFVSEERDWDEFVQRIIINVTTSGGEV